MKATLTLLFASLLLLGGCQKAGEITISTDLSTEIYVAAVPPKSSDLTTVADGFSFTKSQDLLLADNSDIEPYLDKIREIDLKSLMVFVYIYEGITINSISLDVQGIGTLCTKTNISSLNNSFTPDVDVSKLKAAAAKLKADRKITITVSGDVSVPNSFTVEVIFDTDVTAGVLD
jgi:hypothetical protein